MFTVTIDLTSLRRPPIVFIALLWCCGGMNPCLAGDPISFNRDIRPVLSEYCYACHGPDANHREADLRLDDFDAAVESGAIVPGTPDQSLLIERIFSDSPDAVMPPEDTGKKLSAEQKERLSDWILQGAGYQQHWAFESIPDVVPVPAMDGSWPRGELDHFVAHSRIQKNLQPAVEADRSTWLRRVSFDLTGLPPTISELEHFLADDSVGAYERVVNRLLASPAYGERMANLWLDVARYADTFGYQSDIAMEVWPWRDWVIDAFNRNMPYDQFITEQIAGDLIPGADQDQRLATTFNRLHRQTNEGGSIPEEFRLTGIADRTTTAGTAFLGLTLECCRCHDHKFDPIKQSEFYQLSAYFSDVDEFGLYSHFTNAVPTPAMLLYRGNQRREHETAIERVRSAESALQQVIDAASESWRGRPETLIDRLPAPRPAAFHLDLEGEVPGVVGQATRCNGDQEIQANGAPEFGRTSPFTFSIWVNPALEQPRMMVMHQSVAAEDSGFRGLQLVVDEGHPQFSMIHFWPGNAVRVQSIEKIAMNRWTHLAVTHDGSGTAAGIRLFVDGQAVHCVIDRDGLTRDIRHRSEWGDMKAGGVKLALGARFRDIGFRDGLLDELYVFDRQLSAAEVLALHHLMPPAVNEPQAAKEEVESAAADENATTIGAVAGETPKSAHAPIELELAVEHQLLTVDDHVRAAREALQQARDHENTVVTGVRAIMTMRHYDDAMPTHVLHRGDYAAKGDVVRPAVPAIFSAQTRTGESRLDLARWMTDPNHPLTARVIVNRMWHLFFGRGISTTLEDLGSQGSPPSHPELLDFLARSLIDEDWDLHSLCRRIVLSATYRQSSVAADHSVTEQDPNNVWLARGPKHRLSAEQLRDAVLSASGSLSRAIGGPSVMPYQPEGLWEQAGTGKHYNQSKGEGLYRRSMYTFWKRTSPPPSMLTFDATSRESCTARRELTTTPLQALVFLNDPQYVEAARALAEDLIRQQGDRTEQPLEQRWDRLLKTLISRPPTSTERQVIDEMYREQLQYFRQDVARAAALLAVGERPVDPMIETADLAATSIVVQTLFAYDETIMLR